MIRISIARDFSPDPFGRYPRHGPWNGELFREKHLKPAFLSNEQVEIDLDGINGEYGSSFLDESFGGLVRFHVPLATVLQKLQLVTQHAYLREEILRYMREAEAKRGS